MVRHGKYKVKPSMKPGLRSANRSPHSQAALFTYESLTNGRVKDLLGRVQIMHYTRKRTVGQKVTHAFSASTSGKIIGILSLLLIVVLPITIFLAQQQHSRETHAATTGNVHYVSKNGTNGDGLSWATAWNELNQINWSTVQPGDIILIDGGSTGMTYMSTLTVGKSGLQGLPITVQRATDPGHNGTVIFFGGSTTPLPYCGQTAWTPPANTLGYGIQMNGNSWVNIDGGTWNGIQVYGFTYRAIYFSGGESNDIMSNMEVHDNGSAYQVNGTWWGEHPGIGLYGGNFTNLAFRYMNIHDNGEDNFQSSGSVNGFTVEYSWLHYTRTVPGVPSEAYNLCSHNDGLQIFGATNAGTNITFQHDILGPGLTNGLIFQPQETNVTLKNSLILDPGSNVTVENTGSASNWTIDHVTSIGQSDNLTLEGSGNTVTNSIFYDGNLLLNSSVADSANNCQWRTASNTNELSGQTVAPQFVTDLSSYPAVTGDITQYPALSLLQNGDFSLQNGSPCAGLGSPITSVNQFLTIVSNETTLTPVPTSYPTFTPTPTIIPTPTSQPTVCFASPAPTPSSGGTNLLLYNNAVSPLFNDYSSAYSARNPCDTSTFVSPPCSYEITYKGYGGINFSVPVNPGNISTALYRTLEWNLNPNKQPIHDFSAVMTFTDGSYTQITLSKALVSTAYAGGWRHISVPVSQLNPYNKLVTSIQLKNRTSGPLAPIHVDDVYLMK
jgi:hypothetical protein